MCRYEVSSPVMHKLFDEDLEHCGSLSVGLQVQEMDDYLSVKSSCTAILTRVAEGLCGFIERNKSDFVAIVYDWWREEAKRKSGEYPDEEEFAPGNDDRALYKVYILQSAAFLLWALDVGVVHLRALAEAASYCGVDIVAPWGEHLGKATQDWRKGEIKLMEHLSRMQEMQEEILAVSGVIISA